MLKKILFILIAGTSIFNCPSHSMEIEEEQNTKSLVNKIKFIDRTPQALTCLQTKVMFEQGGLTLDDLVFENGGDVVRTRKFKLTGIDDSLDFLAYLNNDTVINSTWSEFHNVWFYFYLFPVTKQPNNKENINTKSITFFVKEIKDETKQEDEKIIIFQDRVKFIEKQPEKLTFLQTKIMFLHGSFSIKTEVQENGVEVIKERKFKPELLHGKIEVLNSENDQIINGFWVGSNNAWMFKYSPSPTEGVLFYVREVF